MLTGLEHYISARVRLVEWRVTLLRTARSVYDRDGGRGADGAAVTHAKRAFLPSARNTTDVSATTNATIPVHLSSRSVVNMRPEQRRESGRHP